MGYLDPGTQRRFVRRWVAKRRADWLAVNGPCKRCGSTQKLELHHRDPAEKVSHRIWSWAPARRDAELAKCDVLCRWCHNQAHRELHAARVLRATRLAFVGRVESAPVPVATVRRTHRDFGPKRTPCPGCGIDISYLGPVAPRACSRCIAAEPSAARCAV
jgi:hypothetical protein